MYWLVARYLAAFFIGVALGWLANGWRLNSVIANLKLSHAEEKARIQKEHRERERSLQDFADKIRAKKDAEIKSINSRLVDAINKLRERPSRAESTETCSAANGSQLSKEDAEFLVREAARADEAVANLNTCIQQYNSLR